MLGRCVFCWFFARPSAGWLLDASVEVTAVYVQRGVVLCVDGCVSVGVGV